MPRYRPDRRAEACALRYHLDGAGFMASLAVSGLTQLPSSLWVVSGTGMPSTVGIVPVMVLASRPSRGQTVESKQGDYDHRVSKESR